MVHEDLKAFLSSNLPSGQTVGIVDPKLLQVVKEEVGCKVQGGEVVQEVCRGIRLHMNKFVKALEEKKENMAQLGLGHSYSRSKVKFNVNRSDNMVIQAIALIDQLDKARISNRNTVYKRSDPKVGKELFDIDRALFRASKSRVKRLEVLIRPKYTDNLGFRFLS